MKEDFSRLAMNPGLGAPNKLVRPGTDGTDVGGRERARGYWDYRTNEESHDPRVLSDEFLDKEARDDLIWSCFFFFFFGVGAIRYRLQGGLSAKQGPGL